MKIGLPVIKILSSFYCILCKSEFKWMITIETGIWNQRNKSLTITSPYQVKYFKGVSLDRKEKILNLDNKGYHHQPEAEVASMFRTISSSIVYMHLEL